LKSGAASPHSLRAVGSAPEAKSWRSLLTTGPLTTDHWIADL